MGEPDRSQAAMVFSSVIMESNAKPEGPVQWLTTHIMWRLKRLKKKSAPLNQTKWAFGVKDPSAWLGGGVQRVIRIWCRVQCYNFRLFLKNQWPTAIAGWCGHEICLPILPERILRGQTTSNFCHYNIYWTCGPSRCSWNFYFMDNVAGTYFRNFVWVNFLMGALWLNGK